MIFQCVVDAFAPILSVFEPLDNSIVALLVWSLASEGLPRSEKQI